jgi:polysaccharide chain length determinant protein (PEP-CTERM system associated)
MNNVAVLTWQDYIQILKRRRWLLILPVVLCWCAVWAVCWFLPAVYRSEALILIEQQKVPEHYVVSNVAADLQERLQSMTQQVLSRTRLRRIIEDLHLYSGDKQRMSPDELVERMRKDIKIEMVETPNRPDELTAFRINYFGSDPRLTQQVTSALSAFFIDENLRSREKQSEDTTDFLQTQLEEARKHLEEQEAKLREFKGEHLGELPTQLTSNLQILSGLEARLQDANERLDRAEQQKVYLNSLLSQYQALSKQIRDGEKGTGASPVALDDQLDRLKQQLADLQAEYTDKHPDVVKMKDEIAKTEQLKTQNESDLSKPQDAAAEHADAKDTPAKGVTVKDAAASSDVSDFQGADPRTVSPMLEIRSQIKSNDLEIQDRKNEIKKLELNAEQYKARLNQTPVREQQLADINRDYDQSRANYESLLAKSNQSALSTNLEKRQQGEQFRIIDAPNLPSKPFWPNRLQLSLFGLAGGVVLGVVGAALAESVDDRVHKDKDLSDLSRVPVLGIVPPLLTPSERRGRRWRMGAEMAAGIAMTMVVIGGTVFAFYRG